jgi:alkanesulfonate monooxygenase SsuD/methylene tetrahydromethanopterin reductase-like flavin-dependent oxidoreductase (luciferase family)
MKVSCFSYLTNVGLERPMAEVLDEMREIAIACDQAGWDVIWFAEHHFGHEGYDITPNAILLSADIAARTKRIRVGQAANIITFWHPLRLAEDIALLDNLTRGRLEVALGRGLYHREAVHLNVAADVRDDEQNRALYEETYEVLVKALSNPFFAHQGRFYRFPEPGVVWNHAMSPKSPEFMNLETNELTKLSVQPRCYQQPHPPLWQVVDSPRSITGAAAKKLDAIMWLPTVRTLKERFEWYREARSEAEGREVAPGRGLALLRDLYVADSMEQAKEEAGQAVVNLYQYVCHWRGLGNLLDPGEELPPGGKLDPSTPGGKLDALTYDWLHPRNLLYGTPDYVVEKIMELRQELGLEQLLLYPNPPGLAQDKVMASLKRFNEQVLPRLRAATAP